MNKLLYTVSVVLLGAGLAVAQYGSSQNTQSSTTTTDTQIPSANNSQTSSPDSMEKQNPSHGQNPGSMSGNVDTSSTTSSTDNSGASAEQSSTSAQKKYHKSSASQSEPDYTPSIQPSSVQENVGTNPPQE